MGEAQKSDNKLEYGKGSLVKSQFDVFWVKYCWIVGPLSDWTGSSLPHYLLAMAVTPVMRYIDYSINLIIYKGDKGIFLSQLFAKARGKGRIDKWLT